MSILVQPTVPAWAMPPYPVRRFTVDEYHQMIQTGIVAEDEPVELLEGWITPTMPHNPPHDSTIERADEFLRPKLPGGWRLRIQSAITTDDSEPEPDIAVVPGPVGRFDTQHPEPADIGLLIEVSDSSVEKDRDEKGPIYARAAIAQYWIINIRDRQIEVYTSPSGLGPDAAYSHSQIYYPGDAVPLSIAGQACGTIAVNDLLPRP